MEDSDTHAATQMLETVIDIQQLLGDSATQTATAGDSERHAATPWDQET